MKWINDYLSIMRKNVLTAFWVLLTQYLPAQQYYNDSAMVSGAVEFAKLYYKQKRANQSSIYNGLLHHSYPSYIEGNAYFLIDSFHTGAVVYENILYKDILMKYDVVADQLVVVANEQISMPITLFSPRVKEFSFSGLKFFYEDDTNNISTSLPEGFYQELVSGRATAICKTTKIILESIKDVNVHYEFEQQKRYYILKDSHSYLIKNKKDLLSILKDQKKEVQEFMRTKKLKFRKNKERTIVAVTEFYNNPPGKKS
ncbi:MAG TPA: hypothetical protein VFZ33_19300 [Chitinophagaceae bacterium]